MLRIIADRDPLGNWTAWFDGQPQCAFGGDHEAVALSRLVNTHGINPDVLTIDYDACRDGHMEFTIGGPPCPDCQGSGMYIGLNAVEDCRTCGGKGHV